MNTHTLHRMFGLGLLTILETGIAAPIASAALYTIPKERDASTVQRVIGQDIPAELKKANCGYPKDLKESESLTDVQGVPLKPNTWPIKPGEPMEPDADQQYPDTAYGLTMPDYGACHEIRQQQVPCNFPETCHALCDQVNTDPQYLYKVYRIAECRREYEVTVVTGYDDNGDPIEETQTRVETRRTEDPSFVSDCNSCPDGWQVGGINEGELDVNGNPASDTEDPYEYVGDKYSCTGDADEQTRPIKDGFLLSADFGWVWNGGGPGVNFPESCQNNWTGGEDREHKNCEECNGEGCRTDPAHADKNLSPPDDTQGNGRRYESFYREYTATHTLAPIPGTTTENQSVPMGVNCYMWYIEPITVSDQNLNCVIGTIPIQDLQNRKTTGELDLHPTETPAADTPFTFDALKATNTLSTPTVPPPDTRPPFGETSKYVDVMLQVEKQLSGVPPSVDLIVPKIDGFTFDVTDLSGASLATGSASTMELHAPLQAGMLDEARALLKQSIFSRLQEEAIPLVVPLVSDVEIQASIAEWENWKQAQLAAKQDTGQADDVIAKLKEYAKDAQAYTALRSDLPAYVAAVLRRRDDLSNAIDKWIETRMQPYLATLANRDKMRALLNAWNEFQDASSLLTQQNEQYCKNDTTTPPLSWVEPPGTFTLPKIPAFPDHLTFDFSDISLSNIEEQPGLRIPVLLPIQVALQLPHPPLQGELAATLPDLPKINPLPDPSSLPTIHIEESYGPPPAQTDLISAQELASYTSALRARAKELRNVAARYWFFVWLKDIEKGGGGGNSSLGQDLDPKYQPYMGEPLRGNYPETRLWEVFMRIWSPVGALLTPDVPPYGGPSSSSSSSSSSSPCAVNDDPCRLKEKLIRDRLRITLPSGNSASSFDALRKTVRQETLDEQGALQKTNGNATKYDIRNPQELYDAYPVPDPFPLDASSSSPTP